MNYKQIAALQILRLIIRHIHLRWHRKTNDNASIPQPNRIHIQDFEGDVTTNVKWNNANHSSGVSTIVLQRQVLYSPSSTSLVIKGTAIHH